MHTVFALTQEGKVRARAWARTEAQLETILEDFANAYPNHHIWSIEGTHDVPTGKKAKMVDGKPIRDEQGIPVWEDDLDTLAEREIEQAIELTLLELVKDSVSERAKRKVEERLALLQKQNREFED